jgi:hypothetical protein
MRHEIVTGRPAPRPPRHQLDALRRELARGGVTPMTCTYCGSEIDSLPDETYRAIEGWETIDGWTMLKWRPLDSFACRSCVDEHFVAFGGGDDDEDEATPPDFSAR